MKDTFGYFVTQISAHRAAQIYGWMGEDAAAVNREHHVRQDDGSIFLTVRFAGGGVRVGSEAHPAVEGSMLVALYLPGQNPLPLFPPEAAALGQALIDMAAELTPPGEGAIEMEDLPDAIRAVQRLERSRDD
ncbi:hypothetical protein FB468_0634 [Leucobacter komagatae]|uniref:Uncharacterized protein n=1 Tax=Leucobacter komagatae TaxID=55969 RepID=A0A542Y3I6_9MICO|nr:hypothetical protein [Leucobacter komagatae]TQL42631.1 hypothetical protein FB468_0634 [Leucobacter komagatae]